MIELSHRNQGTWDAFCVPLAPQLTWSILTGRSNARRTPFLPGRAKIPTVQYVRAPRESQLATLPKPT